MKSRRNGSNVVTGVWASIILGIRESCIAIYPKHRTQEQRKHKI